MSAMPEVGTAQVDRQNDSMKLENAIKWCDVSLNFVTGCSGCELGDRCYARNDWPARNLRARGIETFGPTGTLVPVQSAAAKLARLNKLCICDRCHQTWPISSLGNGCSLCHAPGCELRRIRCFANSNGDIFDQRWPVEVLAGALDSVRLAPNADVILLTKQPQLWRPRMSAALDFAKGARNEGLEHFLRCWDNGKAEDGFEVPPYVWLGVSVPRQQDDWRIRALLAIPAAVRFVSAEPILQKMDLGLKEWRPHPLGRTVRDDIGWVIVGGLTGPDWQEGDCGPDAIVSVARQCQAAGVPCWVKGDAGPKQGQQGRLPDDVFALRQLPITVASPSLCARASAVPDSLPTPPLLPRSYPRWNCPRKRAMTLG